MTHPGLDLSSFRPAGYDRGRGAAWQVAWLAVSGLVTSRWWCPLRLRVALLRLFGADLGRNVLIRHRVRIHWPWKLTVGDNSWIGEQVWILNLEPVVIGRDVCVSQDVLLCTGSHDRRSRSFDFDNAPITIGDGAWVAARSTVLRGVSIGAHAVVGAACLVTRDVPAHAVLGAPAGTPLAAPLVGPAAGPAAARSARSDRPAPDRSALGVPHGAER